MFRQKETCSLFLDETSQASCQAVLYSIGAEVHLKEIDDLKDLLESNGEKSPKVDVKPCTIHLCQSAVNYTSHNININKSCRSQKVVLVLLLNRIVKDDLRYTVSEDRLWHKCLRKVKKKWTTYFLNLQDTIVDKWDSLYSKLDRALEVIQKERSKLASSFILVVLEDEVENIYTEAPCIRLGPSTDLSPVSGTEQLSVDAILSPSEGPIKFIWPSRQVPTRQDQNLTVERTRNWSVSSNGSKKSVSDNNLSTLSSTSPPGLKSQLEAKPSQSASGLYENQPSKSDTPGQGCKSSPSLTLATGNQPLSIPPPFEPAPFIPQTVVVQEEPLAQPHNALAERTSQSKADTVSDSLYIHRSELPSTFQSILLSAENDSFLISKGTAEKNVMTLTGKKSRGSSEKEMAAKSQREQDMEKLANLLETSINTSDRQHAAEYAGKLAQADVCVTVVVQPLSLRTEEKDPEFWLKVYIEDKETSAGKISLKVKTADTIRDLKNKMLMKHMFPVEVQTWIIGKRIPPDGETLSRCGIKGAGNTAFLYLVSARSVGLTAHDFQERMEQTLMTPPTPMSGGTQTPVQTKQEGYEMPGRLFSTKQSLPTPKHVIEHQGLARLHYPQSAEPQLLTEGPGEDMYITASVLQGMNQLQLTKQPDNVKRQLEQRQPHAAPAVPDYHLPELPVNQKLSPQQQIPAVFAQGQVQAQGQGQAQLTDRSKDELENGWACSACTYINKPTRPGCEVCTHPRPQSYIVPENYVMTEEEQERLDMEEMLEQQTRKAEETRQAQQKKESMQNYQMMRQIDSHGIVPNTHTFPCPICFDDIEPGDGAVLRECLHSFCKDCLKDAIQYNEEPVLKCPYVDNQYTCNGVLQDREVKALVSREVYDKHLARSLSTAESQAQDSFHCKTADCPGWCIYEDHVNFFVCPVCRKENCLTCKAIHMGRNCKQYQEDLKKRSSNDREARKTQQMIDKMVEDGNAMPCPQCQVVMMKKDGCDWIQCSICKTEICWVTKGPRWGPLGNGDTSGGCMCRVNGKVCHVECNNCH